MVRNHHRWIAYGLGGALVFSAPLALAFDQSQHDQADYPQPGTSPQTGGTQSGTTQGSSTQSGSTSGSASGSGGSMQGQTQGQSMSGSSGGSREQSTTAAKSMDDQKSELRDKVKKQLDDAQSQIDTLQGDMANQSGAMRVRNDRILKQVIAQRDALNVDLMTIDNASKADWAQIEATVNQDLATFKTAVQRVAALKLGSRDTGQTNRQPQK